MKVSTFLLTFVAGAIVGGAAHWYLTQPRSQEVVANARAEVRETSTKVGDSFNRTFDSEKIKEELAHTGKVVREKASKAGEAIADAAGNARITASIKTKLIADSGLSAFKIDVDTTDGVVTLSGTVSSAENIGNAMKIAMDTEGVQRVISTLTVKP